MKSFDTNEVGKKDQVTSSNHITMYECDNSDSKIKPVQTPETLEDKGQATVNDLEELNLGTNDEPYPIYESSLLTAEEEKKYFISCQGMRKCFPGATKKCLD